MLVSSTQLVPDRRAPVELQRVFRLVFAGGGTGGHLTPGLAVAEELARRVPSDIVFLTTGKKVEHKLLAHSPVRAVPIASAPAPRSLVGAMRFIATSVRGVAHAWRHLGTTRPHAVVALGGYGAFPVALAARCLGIPLVLFEQNVIPGKTTRWLSRWARLCITQWPLPDFALAPRCRQVVRGNPVRRQIFAGNRQEALLSMGLNVNKRTLLVMGGSQGAQPINAWIAASRDLFRAYASRVQLIVIAGQDGECANLRAIYNGLNNVRVLPFASNMGSLLAASDLVISRAGATSIAECTAVGKPMVLIPYPQAADAHQLHNALYCSRAGAALVHEQAFLDQNTWTMILGTVLFNDWVRYAMADASAKLGRPDAAATVAKELLRVMGQAVRKDERVVQWLDSQRRPAVVSVTRRMQSALAYTPSGHPGDFANQLDLQDLSAAA